MATLQDQTFNKMATRHRNIYLFILGMIVVTIMTWALGMLDFKYKLESEVAFQNGFPGELDKWQRAGDWSNVVLEDNRITVNRNSGDRSFAKRNFNLANYENRGEHKLRVRGVLETVQRVSDSDTRGAAFMIWLEDPEGEVLNYLTVQSLTGERDTYHAERIVSIPESAGSFTIVLNSRDSASTFSLVDASAEVISVTPYYQAVSMLLMFSWLLLLALGGKWFLQNATPALFITTGILVLTIIAGVLLPESITTVYIDPFFQKLVSTLPSAGSDSAELVYKLGHFMFFFFITFVLMLNADTLPISRTQLLILLVLLAIASEGMQLHLFNRSTRLFDLGVDISGILLAWCVTSLIRSTRTA